MTLISRLQRYWKAVTARISPSSSPDSSKAGSTADDAGQGGGRRSRRRGRRGGGGRDRPDGGEAETSGQGQRPSRRGGHHEARDRARGERGPQPAEAEFTYVDTQDGLAGLLDHLQGQTLIAIDTEADNLHHYETRVCLIQVSAGGRQFIVDPLAGIDLAPFFDLLAQKSLLMHGSDYDLRLLWDLTKFRPAEVFDTMLAAQLIGRERIGLASLLEEYLGIHHPKDSQKADWSRRPLPPKMLNYAAGDVAHLFEIHRILTDELTRLGRLDWHRQKCRWQIDVATVGFPEENVHAWRIGPSRGMSPRALAALYELWHWREAEAKRLDRPPFKVMSNDYLAKLALAVADGSHREVYERLPNGLRRGPSRGLLETLERGLERDPKSLPRRDTRGPRPDPLDAEELARQDRIKSHRDKVAHELQIDATLIASRSQIAQLCRAPAEADKVLQPWQVDLLRPVLESFVAQ
ncbi:MAG: HRDC domain-containing protein [Opitutaceae bacterium]|nr:HRDC domain-containing protein [Opitutaceae bacterium]